MLAVFKKEFKGYFNTAIGYIVLAVFYFFLGSTFVGSLYAQGSPQVEALLVSTQIIAIFFVPILTMRLMSDERRQRTDQALLTAPVKLINIVMGKFLAAFSVYALCFAPTLLFELITADHIPTLDFFPYFYSLLGMFLLGGVLIALGMFISSLTESQVVAAILGIVANLFALFAPTLASQTGNEFLMKIGNSISFVNAVQSFSEQRIAFADIVYFLCLIAIFLFLCTRSLQKRRWS